MGISVKDEGACTGRRRVEGYEEGTCDEEIGVMEGMLVGNNEFNKTELVGNTLGLLV